MKKLLRIAVQSKGRLNEESVKLIEGCGIKIELKERQLLSRSTNFPIEILYLRDDDIPEVVASGVADIGIVGENEVWEKDKNVIVLKPLGFGKCHLSLAIPEDKEYSGFEWFDQKVIATSYPLILQKFFNGINIRATIRTISGSVEISPMIGLSDGIFDIVSSKETLNANHLREVQIVSLSEAVLISSPNLSLPKKLILDEFIFRMESVMCTMGKKYIMLNTPNEQVKQILGILSGAKSPTIMPLAQKGWSSIHSVIEEKYFWENISKLKLLGAEGILVLPIEKMIL